MDTLMQAFHKSNQNRMLNISHGKKISAHRLENSGSSFQVALYCVCAFLFFIFFFSIQYSNLISHIDI